MCGQPQAAAGQILPSGSPPSEPLDAPCGGRLRRGFPLPAFAGTSFAGMTFGGEYGGVPARTRTRARIRTMLTSNQ